jgi:hypothetical protein
MAAVSALKQHSDYIFLAIAMEAEKKVRTKMLLSDVALQALCKKHLPDPTTLGSDWLVECTTQEGIQEYQGFLVACAKVTPRLNDKPLVKALCSVYGTGAKKSAEMFANIVCCGFRYCWDRAQFKSSGARLKERPHVLAVVEAFSGVPSRSPTPSPSHSPTPSPRNSVVVISDSPKAAHTATSPLDSRASAAMNLWGLAAAPKVATRASAGAADSAVVVADSPVKVQVATCIQKLHAH